MRQPSVVRQPRITSKLLGKAKAVVANHITSSETKNDGQPNQLTHVCYVFTGEGRRGQTTNIKDHSYQSPNRQKSKGRGSPTTEP